MGVGKTAKGAKCVHRTAEYTDHGIEAVPSEKKSKGLHLENPETSTNLQCLTVTALSVSPYQLRVLVRVSVADS